MDFEEQQATRVAEYLTDRALAERLTRIADDPHFETKVQRVAYLREAARRLREERKS